MPAVRAASAIDRPNDKACSRLSMTHGPAMSTSAPRPSTTASVTRTSATAGDKVVTSATSSAIADGGDVHGNALIGHLPFVGGLDEAGKQRMRTQRFGLELRMELHRHEPGMPGHLDDLDELAV